MARRCLRCSTARTRPAHTPCEQRRCTWEQGQGLWTQRDLRLALRGPNDHSARHSWRAEKLCQCRTWCSGCGRRRGSEPGSLRMTMWVSASVLGSCARSCRHHARRQPCVSRMASNPGASLQTVISFVCPAHASTISVRSSTVPARSIPDVRAGHRRARAKCDRRGAAFHRVERRPVVSVLRRDEHGRPRKGHLGGAGESVSAGNRQENAPRKREGRCYLVALDPRAVVALWRVAIRQALDAGVVAGHRADQPRFRKRDRARDRVDGHHVGVVVERVADLDRRYRRRPVEGPELGRPVRRQEQILAVPWDPRRRRQHPTSSSTRTASEGSEPVSSVT